MLQLNSTNVLGEYSRILLRSTSGTSAVYDFTAQLYGSTEHGLDIGFEVATLHLNLKFNYFILFMKHLLR